MISSIQLISSPSRRAHANQWSMSDYPLSKISTRTSATRRIHNDFLYRLAYIEENMKLCRGHAVEQGGARAGEEGNVTNVLSMLTAVSEVDECAHLAHLFRSCTYAQKACSRRHSPNHHLSLQGRVKSHLQNYTGPSAEPLHPIISALQDTIVEFVSGTITTTPLAGYYRTALIRKRGAEHGSAIYLPTPESTWAVGAVCES